MPATEKEKRFFWGCPDTCHILVPTSIGTAHFYTLFLFFLSSDGQAYQGLGVEWGGSVFWLDIPPLYVFPAGQL